MVVRRVNPQLHLWKPRTKPILILEFHATRGGGSHANQFPATCGWMENPNNDQGGWGGSCSEVIGDGDLGIVLEDNQMPTYGAGYGGAGSTYAIDEYGIAFEICQSASLEDYTDEEYELVSQRAALKCRSYNIPVRFVTIDRQVGEPPPGFVRHDRCENGYKSGKSDPGDKFSESRVITRINQILGAQEDDMFEQADRDKVNLIYAMLFDPVPAGVSSVRRGDVLTLISQRLFGLIPNKWSGGNYSRLEKLEQTTDLLVDQIDTPAGKKARMQYLIEQVGKIGAVDINALATAIVAKLPPTTLTPDAVKTAVKEALKEGVV